MAKMRCVSKQLNRQITFLLLRRLYSAEVSPRHRHALPVISNLGSRLLTEHITSSPLVTAMLHPPFCITLARNHSGQPQAHRSAGAQARPPRHDQALCTAGGTNSAEKPSGNVRRCSSRRLQQPSGSQQTTPPGPGEAGREGWRPEGSQPAASSCRMPAHCCLEAAIERACTINVFTLLLLQENALTQRAVATLLVHSWQPVRSSAGMRG